MSSLRSKRAFTLIELLVVITIIGILMGLLFPAVGSALHSAKRAQAKNDAVNIATAISSYESEYGRFPNVDGTNVNNAQLMNILAGKEERANPRQIIFLEIPRAKGGKNGALYQGQNYTSGWLDPWGEEFEVRIDDDYDNEVEFDDGGETINKQVIVWSMGDPKREKNDPEKAIKSWE